VGGEKPPQASVAAEVLKLGAALTWRCRLRREQPRQRSGGAALPDAPATPARRNGIAQANECLMPRDSKTALNLADVGRRSSGAVSVYGCSSFAPPSWYGTEDRAESLRRTRGEAVGVKLDPIPVKRCAVNVGSVLRSPFPADDQPVGRRAGPSSADGPRTWQSLRSSPSAGEPRTWRRKAVGLQGGMVVGGRR
jgi:hypothetical protein